jgi:DNA repair photolyase
MVSGRTDIVAFYSDWFFKRLEEGFVNVRNPFCRNKVSKINFFDVDGILFCTKNPIPILEKIDKINIPFLFHVTLTPYKKDIEPNVPPKGKIIESIKRLSEIIGKDRIYVRYDPVFISDKYDINYHIKAFDNLCNLLDGYVNKIIISFLDDYKNVRKNIRVLKVKQLIKEDYEVIGTHFSESAKKHDMTVQTCFEEMNLVEYGFVKQDCLSSDLAFKLTGKTNFKKWKAREGNKCSCVEMVDIGVYNSCKHFCKYCYANYDEKIVTSNSLKHNCNSPFLVGESENEDEIKIRKA